MGEFDEAGATFQESLVELARRYGMRLIGPNCMGLVNVHHRLTLSSTATLTCRAFSRPGPENAREGQAGTGTAQLDELFTILQRTLDEAFVHARENHWL